MLFSSNLVFTGAHGTGTPITPGGPPGTPTFVVAGDNLATIQSKLNSVSPGDSLVFPGGNTFNLGGNLTGKSGITVWADGVVTITNGDFVFDNKNDWTIRGSSANQTSTSGFVFSGASRISASHVGGDWVIANCSFLNNTLRPASGPSAGSDGSAIYYPFANPTLGTDSGLIVNCNFTGCNGVVVGTALTANCNNITHDGLHFLNCRQPSSLQFSLSSGTLYGNNIVYRRCAFEGTTRACLEFGPNSNGPEYMNGLICDNNWFGNFNHVPNTSDGTMLPMSFVAINAVNTTITNNFAFVGPISINVIAPAIEMAGSGDCSNNVSVDFTWFCFTYASGWNVHDNDYYNSGHTFVGGYANNGSGTGTMGPNNRIHGAYTGVIPPYPTRIPYL